MQHMHMASIVSQICGFKEDEKLRLCWNIRFLQFLVSQLNEHPEEEQLQIWRIKHQISDLPEGVRMAVSVWMIDNIFEIACLIGITGAGKTWIIDFT